MGASFHASLRQQSLLANSPVVPAEHARHLVKVVLGHDRAHALRALATAACLLNRDGARRVRFGVTSPKGPVLTLRDVVDNEVVALRNTNPVAHAKVPGVV